jgi:hypothetical protein
MTEVQKFKRLLLIAVRLEFNADDADGVDAQVYPEHPPHLRHLR